MCRILFHLLLLACNPVAWGQEQPAGAVVSFTSIETEARDSVTVGRYRVVTWVHDGQRVIDIIAPLKSVLTVERVPEHAPAGRLEWRLANGVPVVVIAEVSSRRRWAVSKRDVPQRRTGRLLMIRGLGYGIGATSYIDTAIDAGLPDARVIARRIADGSYGVRLRDGKK